VAIALAIALPGPFVLWVLLRNAVNIPFMDEWAWGVQLVQLHDGMLSLGSLWQPHNEHRIFFPSLIALGLASVFGWNVIFESVIGIAFLTLSQVPLYRITRDSLGKNWGTAVFVIESAIFFSLGQVENIMWGFQFTWFMIVFCMLCVVDLLRIKKTGFAEPTFAGVLCLIAAYSAAFGLLVPIVAAITVALRRTFRLRDIAAWAVYAIVLVLVYMWHLQEDSVSFAQPHAPESFAVRIAFLAAYLGSPLAGWAGSNVCVWVGFVGLLLMLSCVLVFISVAKSGEARERWSPFLAIMFFAVGAAALTDYGRVDLGVGEALSSRYTTLGADFWLALLSMIVLVLSAYVGGRRRIVKPVAIATAFAVCIAIAYGIGRQNLAGYEVAENTIASRMPALVALQNVSTARSSDIKDISPDPVFVRDAVKKLERAGYWPLR
jgi:hypothetical protein